MGSENLYGCFQGKLKGLLLGGMVLPVLQDRGPTLHSRIQLFGKIQLFGNSTGCGVSPRLWMRTPKATFTFLWV